MDSLCRRTLPGTRSLLSSISCLAALVACVTVPNRTYAGSPSYSFVSINNPLAGSGVPDQGTYLYGLNNVGQAAGAYFDGSHWNGFLYGGGTFTPIHDPNQGPIGIIFPLGINDTGTVAGYYYDANQTWRGFSYLNGTYSAIDDPGAGSAPDQGTVPVGINSSGVIVGYYKQTYDVNHGFIYNPGTHSFVTIDDPNASMTPLSGAVGTFPRAINASGQIVGSYADVSGITHGFLYDNGVFSTIDDPLGTDTLLNGINDAGDIVGYYKGTDTILHGFVFSSLTFTSIDVPGALGGTEVWGINNAGQISGNYYEADRTSHGFIGTLNAPEPSALSLASLGGFLLVCLRSRRSAHRNHTT